jgi:hypothetical protein
VDALVAAFLVAAGCEVVVVASALASSVFAELRVARFDVDGSATFAWFSSARFRCDMKGLE